MRPRFFGDDGAVDVPLTKITTRVGIVALLGAAACHAGEAEQHRVPVGEPVPLDPLAMGLEPGQWREYRFVGGSTGGAVVRWTWLETEQHDDHTYQWFETAMTHKDRRTVSRVLGNRDDPGSPPARVIMQTGETPAMEMPAEMRKLAAPALQRYALNPPRKLDAPAEVDVPAGRFVATVFEAGDGASSSRSYFADTLPGIVLYEGPGGGMELVAFGGGGKTAISGEIRPYSPLPPGVQPRGPGVEAPP